MELPTRKDELELAAKYELIDAYTTAELAAEYGISIEDVHRIATRTIRQRPQPRIRR